MAGTGGPSGAAAGTVVVGWGGDVVVVGSSLGACEAVVPGAGGSSSLPSASSAAVVGAGSELGVVVEAGAVVVEAGAVVVEAGAVVVEAGSAIVEVPTGAEVVVGVSPDGAVSSDPPPQASRNTKPTEVASNQVAGRDTAIARHVRDAMDRCDDG